MGANPKSKYPIAGQISLSASQRQNRSSVSTTLAIRTVKRTYSYPISINLTGPFEASSWSPTRKHSETTHCCANKLNGRAKSRIHAFSKSLVIINLAPVIDQVN